MDVGQLRHPLPLAHLDEDGIDCGVGRLWDRRKKVLADVGRFYRPAELLPHRVPDGL
jgi:hypothetical protein